MPPTLAVYAFVYTKNTPLPIQQGIPNKKEERKGQKPKITRQKRTLVPDLIYYICIVGLLDSFRFWTDIVRKRFRFWIDIGRNKAKQKIHADDLSLLNKKKPKFAGLVRKQHTRSLI